MWGRALEHKPPGAWTPSWVEVPGPPVAETVFPPEMGAEPQVLKGLALRLEKG